MMKDTYVSGEVVVTLGMACSYKDLVMLQQKYNLRIMSWYSSTKIAILHVRPGDESHWIDTLIEEENILAVELNHKSAEACTS